VITNHQQNLLQCGGNLEVFFTHESL